MTKIFLKTSVVFLVLTALSAQAVISPVRLKVTRNRKQERKQSYSSTDGNFRKVNVSGSVFYTIEVSSATAAAVNNLQVKWALLVQPQDRSQPLYVVQGERSANLAVGQKLAFDTDAVEIKGEGWEDHWSGHRGQNTTEVLGYAVEVLVDGKVVASDITPADTKKRIEELKGK